MTAKGKVYLIGAGPGDPGLITVKGLECLRAADVVIYDRLASPELLREAGDGAEQIYVGKSAGHHALPQEEINALIVRKALEGKIVTRLKGGDPFVFGRGGEEALALRTAGIEFEVVPRHHQRNRGSRVRRHPSHAPRIRPAPYRSSQGTKTPAKTAPTWSGRRFAVGSGTLVFLMGVRNLPSIVEALLQHGRAPDTPAAVIRRGTESAQQTVVGHLDDIVQKAQTAGITPAGNHRRR